ncbi:MAG TPA: alpha/beta hydrolase [Thermotogota bacterium]|nr:alpha/beta hydrolase [Thermotogota bacterium]
MLYIIIFLILDILFIGYLAFRYVNPRVRKYELTKKVSIQVDNLDIKTIFSLQNEEFYIDSDYGYKLHGFVYPHPGSSKIIVFSHGITWSLWGSMKYVVDFYKLGFNIILYDHRGHGKSGGKKCTYGIYERYDLKKICDFAFERFGHGSLLGVHGESLGAVIALQHAEIDKRTSFLIADSAFSDLRLLFRKNFKRLHLVPLFFLPLINLFMKITSNLPIKKVSIKKIIRNIDVPILFVHGKRDYMVPYSMSVDLYNEKTHGKRDLLLVEQGKHADSYKINREKYFDKCKKFLSEIGIL